MFRPAANDGSHAPEEDIPEAGPVFVVVVKEEGDPGICEDVANAPEVDGLGALGLPVYDRVDGFAVEGVADGDEMGGAC